MSPKQIVVIENNALKRFVRRYGYCISAGRLAGVAEAALSGNQTADGGVDRVYSAGFLLTVKRRGERWFVTDIDKTEE